jgi:hypothetical protein
MSFGFKTTAWGIGIGAAFLGLYTIPPTMKVVFGNNEDTTKTKKKIGKDRTGKRGSVDASFDQVVECDQGTGDFDEDENDYKGVGPSKSRSRFACDL